MPKRKGRLTRSVAGNVVVSAKEYVDDRVGQATREFAAEVRGSETRIDVAVAGMNAKMDAMSAKLDVLLQLVRSILNTVCEMRTVLNTIKEMLSSKSPIGFRKGESA